MSAISLAPIVQIEIPERGRTAEVPAQDVLTGRQIEVLKLIANGYASKEIASALGLSSKTVDVHRSRIMERLNIGAIASLTLYSVRQGLVDPELARSSPLQRTHQRPGATVEPQAVRGDDECQSVPKPELDPA